MPHAEGSDFADLVESAAVLSSTAATPSLTTQLDGIPRLSRTLRQVSEASLDVLRSQSSLPDSSNAVHADALRVLARRGFKPDRLRLAVRRISEQSPFIPRTSLHRHVDCNAAQLLNIQRSAVASRAADEARLRANASFQQLFVNDVADDLTNSRTEIVDLMESVVRNRSFPSKAVDFSALSPRTPGFQFPSRTPQAMPRRSFATPRRSGGSTRRASSRPQSHWTPRTPGGNGGPMHVFSADPAYLSVIQSSLAEGDLPSIATEMHSIAVDKYERPHLREIFAILANLASFEDVNEVPDSHARSYSARSVLEDQFGELSGVFTLKPRLASPFAVRNDVLQFVSKLNRNGKLADVGPSPQIFNGQPLWAQVFYCFRVGNVEAALEVVQEARAGGIATLSNFEALLYSFIAEKHAVQDEYGKEADFYVGTLMDANEYYTLFEEYRTKVWNSGDAYFRACYFLLARLELAPSTGNKDSTQFSDTAPYPLQPPHERTSFPLPDSDFSALFGSVEDYMWMRLFISRGEREYVVFNDLTQFQFVEFEQVQKELKACGPKHFDAKGSNPLLYAFVLVCAGLYWNSVEYLSNTGIEQHIADAANIGVVLYLLKWIEDVEEYYEILWRYIDLIKGTQPEDAATYVLTIRESENLLKYIRRLVFETEEYSVLLGVPSTGTHKGVFAEMFLKMPDNFAVLTSEDLEELRKNASRMISENENAGRLPNLPVTQRSLQMD